MGGTKPRAGAPIAPHPDRPCPTSVAPALSVTHAPPSFLRPHRHSCAVRNPPTPTPSPSPIHPSPLPGGRLGGGTKPRAGAPIAPHPIAHASPPSRPHSPSHTPPPSFLRPLPSFLRRQEPTHPSVLLLPNSSLPPSRGEVRWGVGRPEPPPPALQAPIAHASHSPSSLHPLRHSCAGRNHRTPPTSPNSCYAHTRTGVPNHASLPTTPPTRPPRRQPQPCQRGPKLDRG